MARREESVVERFELRDIMPLTEFRNRTSDYSNQLRESKRPLVLTRNGKAELVVMNAAAFEHVFRLAELAATVLAVREAEQRMDAGEGYDLDELKQELARRDEQS